MSCLPDDSIRVSKLNIRDCFSLFHSSEKGLTEKSVANNTIVYGKNELKQSNRNHILIEYLETLKSPLVCILLAVSVVSIALGEYFQSIIVALMVLLSSILNFFQEHRASRAAEKLQERVAHTTEVVRDGITKTIATKHLVPGDVILLNAGDLIPADCKLFEAKDLFVSQSALTGESFPVEKSIAEPVKPTEDISSLTNLVFAGSSVVTGSAKAIVYKTGSNTVFGAIANKIDFSLDQNEFTIGIQNFSFLILRIVILFVVCIFTINFLAKGNFWQSLLFSIAVAVGLTPEFLPMVMSVTMGLGSVSMAKKGVIVKRLTAIPTFGSMDILATDKTGTLTEDNIQLVKYTDIDGELNDHVLLMAYLNASFESGITNPLDSSILKIKKINIQSFEKIDEIPFDFIRKRLSIVVSQKGKHTLITKGAPENILPLVTEYMNQKGEYKKITPLSIKRINEQYDLLSRDGFRVLAVAIKPIGSMKKTYTREDETELTFLGFLSFLDPPKKGVRQAIDELEKMGISIKVITGDNELVTEKICHEADIPFTTFLLGSMIDELDDPNLYTKAMKTTIFARCSPIQKERIIRVLRSYNHVVGYLGDGINDAPSLKSADVGISVSNAVDVAKESADIILTSKSLHELKDGVLEGRKTFGNTMKYILMGLSSNFGNMFSVLTAVLFLPFLPMLPIQILLNNLLYDLGQLTIPTDSVDRQYVQKPKRWDMKSIQNFMLTFGPVSSVFDIISFIFLYSMFKNNIQAFQTGWFLESLTTQTLVIHLIRTRRIPGIESNASISIWISTLGAIGIAWLLPYLPIGAFFNFTILPPKTLLTIGLIVIGYLLSAETVKQLYYRLYDTSKQH